MNDATEDLFSALYTMYTADTGDGGLATQTNTDASENPAYVRAMFDNSDQRLDRNNMNWPCVRVTINLGKRDPFGYNGYSAEVQFDLMTDRDRVNPSGRTPQNAAGSRIRTVYRGQTPTATTDWKFGTIRFLRSFVGETSGKVQTRVIQAAIEVTAT